MPATEHCTKLMVNTVDLVLPVYGKQIQVNNGLHKFTSIPLKTLRLVFKFSCVFGMAEISFKWADPFCEHTFELVLENKDQVSMDKVWHLIGSQKRN